MWPNPQEIVHTCTKEIRNEKLHFLSSTLVRNELKTWNLTLIKMNIIDLKSQRKLPVRSKSVIKTVKNYDVDGTHNMYIND